MIMAELRRVKMSSKSKKSTAARVAGESKISWLAGRKNPFREGSAVHKRVELVRKASGRTRDAIEKIRGVRRSTVPNLLRMKIVRAAA
jgi:hypothetical protein